MCRSTPSGTRTLQDATDAFLDQPDLAGSTRRVYRASLPDLVADLGPATAVGERSGPRLAGWFRARHGTDGDGDLELPDR